jgi:hypothetical protein
MKNKYKLYLSTQQKSIIANETDNRVSNNAKRNWGSNTQVMDKQKRTQDFLQVT